MPIFSGGNDKSPNRDEPFTGDGRNSNDARLPLKGEVIVRDGDGTAKLKQTDDLFKR